MSQCGSSASGTSTDTRTLAAVASRVLRTLIRAVSAATRSMPTSAPASPLTVNLIAGTRVIRREALDQVGDRRRPGSVAWHAQRLDLGRPEVGLDLAIQERQGDRHPRRAAGRLVGSHAAVVALLGRLDDGG